MNLLRSFKRKRKKGSHPGFQREEVESAVAYFLSKGGQIEYIDAAKVKQASTVSAGGENYYGSVDNFLNGG